MGKKIEWDCKKIIKKLHSVSKLEIEQRLAELWEVLVENKCQFLDSEVLLPVKSESPLFKNKRSVR